MSDPNQRDTNAHEPEEESPPGPNLVLLYGLIALALAVAIGLAALIVLPFYQRH